MSDLTTSIAASLGYVLAFLVPGSSALLAMFVLTHPGRNILQYLSGYSSGSVVTGGLLLAALGLGVFVAVVRWFIFEWLIWRKVKHEAPFGDDVVEKLALRNRLDAYRLVVIEQYRYHQFCGGVALTLPPLIVGLTLSYDPMAASGTWVDIVVCLLISEALLIFNAFKLLDVYFKRTGRLLVDD